MTEIFEITLSDGRVMLVAEQSPTVVERVERALCGMLDLDFPAE